MVIVAFQALVSGQTVLMAFCAGLLAEPHEAAGVRCFPICIDRPVLPHAHELGTRKVDFAFRFGFVAFGAVILLPREQRDVRAVRELCE